MVCMSLPSFVVPGVDFPAWSPWVFGVIGLVTIAVLVYQAVRYFRDDRNRGGQSRDDRNSGDQDRSDQDE